MTNEELLELKEIAIEVDKLIKYSLEMKTVTKYKNDEKKHSLTFPSTCNVYAVVSGN